MDIKPQNLIQRVLRFARGELDKRKRPDERQLQLELERTPNWDEPVSLPMSEPRLEVVRPHDGGSLTLQWAVTRAHVERAQALIVGNPVLCVRLVNFSKARDDVRREVQDRPNVDLSGQCEIGEPAQRAVVSLGLRAGDRFVSIAHHVL